MMAALHIFSQKGYASTTIRDILNASGTTAPSLYHYFTNKEDLFKEIMKIHLLKIDYFFESYTDNSASAKTRLKNIVDKTFLFILENRDFFRCWFGIYYGPPQGNPPQGITDYHASEFHIKLHSLIKKTFLEGIRAKEFESGNQSAMAWSIRAMFQLAINEMIKDGSIKSIDRDGLQRYLDFILEKFKK